MNPVATTCCTAAKNIVDDMAGKSWKWDGVKTYRNSKEKSSMKFGRKYQKLNNS